MNVNPQDIVGNEVEYSIVGLLKMRAASGYMTATTWSSAPDSARFAGNRPAWGVGNRVDDRVRDVHAA